MVQLPPSFTLAPDVVDDFCAALRARVAGDIVCEPRHRTWFSKKADDILARYRITRVATDLALAPRAAEPGGWDGLAYIRLHGTPRTYHSSYSADTLSALADRLTRLTQHRASCWCVFDNTAAGAATSNALHLKARLRLSKAHKATAGRARQSAPPPA